MDAWLTHLILEPGSVPTTHGRIDGDSLHRNLMRLVPNDLGDQPRRESGLLYRVEQDAEGFAILAQTLVPPRLDTLPAGFAEQARERCLTPLLCRLRPGMPMRYRIVANPTKRHGRNADPKKRGKLAVLRGQDADLWWLRKATEAGFHPLRVESSATGDIIGANGTSHGRMRFDGTGIVTDPDRLRMAITNGIGRAKSYGCGLLSLGPVEVS